MPEARHGEVVVHYETEGDPAAPPLLLVMGLGAQLTAWPVELRAALVERGFYVIRFDNRDVGLSTWFDHAGPADPLGALAGTASSPYLLSDMAADAVAVLDDLGVEHAHVVGVSMGGMIVQTMAIEHAGRLRSMTSIMSTTGDRTVGQADPAVFPILLRPPATGRDEAIVQGLGAARAISSPGYPFDEDRVRARIGEDFDRAYHPAGTARQLVAIMCSGDRSAALRDVAVPTLVIHGEGDPLVNVSGGRATAAAIPGARLQLIPGMGHDLPQALVDTIADAIAGHAGQADAAR